MRRQVGTVLRCRECGSESEGLARGWRAYLAPELDDDHGEMEVLMFCPQCAQREFGPFGWEQTDRRDLG
jgi:hypothetical protein